MLIGVRVLLREQRELMEAAASMPNLRGPVGLAKEALSPPAKALASELRQLSTALETPEADVSSTSLNSPKLRVSAPLVDGAALEAAF